MCCRGGGPLCALAFVFIILFLPLRFRQLAIVHRQALEQELAPIRSALGEHALTPLGQEGDDYDDLLESQYDGRIVEEGEGSEEGDHVEEDGRDLEGIGDLEEADEGVLLEVGAGVGLDIGEALEVVLERVELEGGEAALCEPAGLELGLSVSE